MNKYVLSEISRMKEIMGLLNEKVVTDHDRTYDYKKEEGKYFAKRKSSDTWIEAKGSPLEAIKTKVFRESPSQNRVTSSLPFKTKQEGDMFRKWVNDNYPEYAKQIGLNVSGSHKNRYIITAWNKYGKNYTNAPKKSQPKGNKKNNIVVSDDIASEFLSQINFNSLSTSDTTHNFCKPGQEHCAQFVNDISSDVSYVGNAWTAYNNSGLGDIVFSSFNNLDNKTQQEVINLWLEIHKRGGGEENGPSNGKVRDLVNRLVPGKGSVKNTDLKINDFVGVFYETSSHHEEAFYEAGIPWFIIDKNCISLPIFKFHCNAKPGNTIKTGKGWGMNTHIGRVFAIKDGVPLIAHNVKGDAQSSPPSELRIAWIKRPRGN